MSDQNRPRLTALIVSLGRSRVLDELLVSLAQQTEIDAVVLVAQAWQPPPSVVERCDRVIALSENLGFAAANNVGLAEARTPFVALINDDAILEAGWAAALLAVLDGDATIAAVQGVNLCESDPEIIDGCGIGWNRWLQATQIGRNEAFVDTRWEKREIFGVSATAAVYRTSALKQVSGTLGSPFDESLGSYYEDVDLACRLRSRGWRSVLVPSARARHVGSVTGQGLPLAGVDLIYANRHLVLAKTLGRAYWLQLPRLLTRDLFDGVSALTTGDWRRVGGVLKAWLRVACTLGRMQPWRAPRLRPKQLLGRTS